MVKNTKHDAWLRRCGLGFGLALAALAASGWSMPAGDRPAGVDATLTVAPTGELGVEPAGELARARDLRPGGETRGSVVVTNQTGRPLAISLRAQTPSYDLDARLHVDATIGDGAALAGTLADAREWQGQVRVPPGGRRRVRVRLSIPPRTPGTAFRAADVRLELHGEPVG